MMDYSQLEQVNKEIKTVELKGKDYAEVKERVIAFRKLFPDGRIMTDLKFTDNYVLAETTAWNTDGIILANGHARELLNKSFAVENAETSSIGRCLGFLGIGINTAIASKEDMDNVESPSGIFDESMNVKDLADKFRELYTNEEQERILKGLKLKRAEDIGIVDLQKYVNYKLYGKK